MKKKITSSILLFSLLSTTAFFSGCSSTNETTSDTSITGQLVDSYLENIDYVCSDGQQGVTNTNGEFHCQTLPVKFTIAGLQLGKISTLNTDKHVFPQDILGLNRADIKNKDVIAMARFLQSCDEDNNRRNGIKIRSEIKEKLQTYQEFNANDIDAYANDVNITLIDENEAIAHLEESTKLVENIDDVDKLPQALKEALLTPVNTLTQEVKNTLASMGNEERLAYDVYNYLYKVHKNNDQEIKQLTNIATKSEITHIQTVQLLVQKYITDVSDFTNVTLENLDYMYIDVEDMPAGNYNIPLIQDLYDSLITKGVQSKQDALEVACIIEVVDINDLAEDIILAQESNADDVTAAFEFLRDGSYKHYWAFDKGLKNMGVTEGCCTLGAEYCHPEYPQTTQGNGKH